EIDYDNRGRVWRLKRHYIDTDGSSVSSKLITELTWFDNESRVIKRQGSALEKYNYDHEGRVTHLWVLANAADTTYSSLYSDTNHRTLVTSDLVLEEHQTVFDPQTGDPIMSVAISRFHDDYGSGETTGPLDTNADADPLVLTASNIKGRGKVDAAWFDSLHRATTRAS